MEEEKELEDLRQTYQIPAVAPNLSEDDQLSTK